MKSIVHRRLRRRSWLALPLCIGLGAASALAAPAKTLTRLHDPVIVHTAAFARATDHRTSRYRLYAATEAMLRPIPFQFDARDQDDTIVIETTDFAFDDDDELVFMAKDTGDRVPAPTLSSEGGDAIWEIEVVEPTDGTRGWAYLVHFSGTPPARSPTRYASFDAATNAVHASAYEITYVPGRNYFTEMRIVDTGRGTSEALLERMRVLLEPRFSLLLATWRPRFTEESFRVTIEGVKNGPVRAIRRVHQSLDLGLLLPTGPSGTMDTYYYASSFTTPSTFSIPWLALKALRGFRFEGVSDLGERALGMEYWDGANPQGLRFDDRSNATVNTTGDHDWYVLSGASGACLHVFTIPEQWRAWGITRGTVFRDRRNGAREESRSNANAYAAGYSLRHIMNLRKAGSYQMSLAVIVLPRPYRPGDEIQPLAMLKQPLRTTVCAVE